MNIFVSYSSLEKELVEGLVKDLEELGHEVWYDPEITGGHEWWGEILEQIRNCELFVFGLTPNSLNSHPCKLEYTYADDLQKRVLPIILQDVNTKMLPPILAKIQFVDYQQDSKSTAFSLIRAFDKLPKPKPLPNPLPTPPAVPLSPIGAIRDRLSMSNLTMDEQSGIFFELKELLIRKETSDDARVLLYELQSRPDLFFTIGKEIEFLVSNEIPLAFIQKELGENREVDEIDLVLRTLNVMRERPASMDRITLGIIYVYRRQNGFIAEIYKPVSDKIRAMLTIRQWDEVEIEDESPFFQRLFDLQTDSREILAEIIEANTLLGHVAALLSRD